MKTHEEKIARAKALLGPRYLLHPANQVKRPKQPITNIPEMLRCLSRM